MTEFYLRNPLPPAPAKVIAAAILPLVDSDWFKEKFMKAYRVWLKTGDVDPLQNLIIRLREEVVQGRRGDDRDRLQDTFSCGRVLPPVRRRGQGQVSTPLHARSPKEDDIERWKAQLTEDGRRRTTRSKGGRKVSTISGMRSRKYPGDSENQQQTRPDRVENHEASSETESGQEQKKAKPSDAPRSDTAGEEGKKAEHFEASPVHEAKESDVDPIS